MNFSWTWYQVTNAFSGALFIILGLLVLRLRNRGPANAAFSWFSIAFGSAFVCLDLLGSGSTWAAPTTISDVLGFVGFTFCMVVAVAALFWLGLVFPVPLERGERSLLALAGALAAAAFGSITPFVADVPSHVAARVATLAEFAIHGGMLGMSALFALRFRSASGLAGSPYAVVSGALVMYPAFYSGIVYGLGLSGRGPILYGAAMLDAVAILGPPLVVACLWLSASARADPVASRSARNVALLALLAMLGGALAVSTATDAGDHWGYGAARTVGVLVLAFGIVRGQMLGVDLQLRWGLSRGTVAATFVAVFFVASEGTQIVFGAENQWLGLLAAGGFVFAIAPLQRAAERLAEKAVPHAGMPPPTAHDKEEAYRRALRFALRDRSLTRDEERDLFLIAGELGLTPVRAFELRDDMERAKGVDE